jgi:beta-galactosidase
VELFLNGKSLGKKTMEPNSHLEWRVPYQPGTLEARGVRNGKQVVTKVETTGQPARIKMAADRTLIQADGEDVTVVAVTAIDDEGREVPVADNLIRFELKGMGKIIGVGNGDPSSHESDKYLVGQYQRRLFNGKCQIIVQSLKEAGPLELKATSDGLKEMSITVKAEAVPLRLSVAAQ